MTFGRGDAVWERYAHNAVRVVDPVDGTDLAYNWGEFDFAQPNFLGRFLTGDTKYSMRAYDAPAFAEAYARRFNRAVYVQELAVAPGRARASPTRCARSTPRRAATTGTTTTTTTARRACATRSTSRPAARSGARSPGARPGPRGAPTRGGSTPATRRSTPASSSR
jgi:hypothetical protein